MRALDGSRVVDLAGPISAYCSKLLADQGAEVTIVEPPGGGLLRHLPPFTPDGSESFFHLYYHAGKQGVVVDPADPGSAADLARLLDSADVVIARAAPAAVAADLGVEVGREQWLAGGGVWCALTPFGLDGPYAGYEATHLTTVASTAFMHDQGPAEGPPVSMPGIATFDEAGIHAAMCIVAALRRRGDAGGQVIDLSVQEVVSGLVHSLQRFALAGVVNKRGAGAIIPPAGTWECSDGYIELQIWQPNQWTAFVELLGSPPELADPSWSDRTERQKAADRIRPVVEAALKQARTLDIYKAAQAARIPSSPVNTLTNFIEDEQVAARDFLVGAHHPALGEHRTLARGYRVDGVAAEAPAPAPRLGEHNDRVFANEVS